MNSHWKFWCNTKDQAAAENVIKPVVAEMGVQPFDDVLAAYEKGGYVASFAEHHATDSWNDFVVDVIQFAQRVGCEWCLTGNVEDQMVGQRNLVSLV